MKEKTKYIIITIVFLILIVVNAILITPPLSYVIAVILGGYLGSLLGDYL
jgi:phosphotransferase system  glucose/maltose/N-acetylglucosamine-specific IIC component